MGFRRRTWFLSRSVHALLLAVLVSGLGAQISEKQPQIGVPEDWTHHRIKFSSATLRQHPERAAHEPRAAMQLYREAFVEAQAAWRRATLAPQSASSSHRRVIAIGASRLEAGVCNLGSIPQSGRPIRPGLPVAQRTTLFLR